MSRVGRWPEGAERRLRVGHIRRIGLCERLRSFFPISRRNRLGHQSFHPFGSNQRL
jgi:hypothetical protein